MTNRKRWIVSLTVGIAVQGILVGLCWLTTGDFFRHGTRGYLSAHFVFMALWGSVILKPFVNYLVVSVGPPILYYFIIFAIPALVYSLITYVILRPKRKSGSTIWEIVIVVAIMVLVALSAAPGWMYTSIFSGLSAPRYSGSSCIANLKQIEGAKQQWAVENKQLPTAVPANSDIFGATLYIRTLPLCPQCGTYTLNAVSVEPTCSRSGAPDFHTLY